MSASIARTLAGKLRNGAPTTDDLQVAAELLAELAALLDAPPAAFQVRMPGRIPDRALFLERARAEEAVSRYHGGAITPLIEAWQR